MGTFRFGVSFEEGEPALPTKHHPYVPSGHLDQIGLTRHEPVIVTSLPLETNCSTCWISFYAR
jgi:hypothetical protein